MGFRQKKFCKLMLAGVLLCMVILMLSVVVYQEKQIDYSWLEFVDDETSEDNCNCKKIIEGDIEEIERAKILTITRTFKNKTKVTDEQYTEVTKDCEIFRTTHKYLPVVLSEEEEAFPLAYSIVVHHKVQNFEWLLRSIYAPQNFYCIHVDKKSPESTVKAINAIVSCFDNVFIASQLEEVVYASWSRVQADLNCMKDLYLISDRWKYLINLCGQDLPIKTNLEMVRALKELGGGNSLETESMPAHKEVRWKKRHIVKDGTIQITDQDKMPPPHGIKLFSGGAYFVVSRAFVHYVFEDPKAQDLMSWSTDTFSPDEFIWATLQRIPGVPGFIRAHSKFDVTDMFSISRLIKWVYHEGSYDAVYPPCQGIHVRAVCVYGVGDLQWMLEQNHLFANKFDVDFDPIAMRCLGKHLRHKALHLQH
ncbi:beta-1,3-galactosyl-O-glycosyl-glycoprotein beta-1,6-N-acetylglucosaminyltransferase-like [Pygocentrus nattereri]|uniref:Beta-1,3-galactosyl-O-glycosyl-glycoprotein beta-1,6-N-acetylglucosaminyltransferase n=1 Tax=Pygocentrus nattereri TaxID=42514 RepID=A0A3B4CL53_PYGNA|nr:beta-1,3-galactosyl-O-glycosyl-glycoprotein beta-1,6-N-acetylglucosaminyltransferase-like [Pygocentrus nattereri]XP_017551904.1 beta-1,3-galactosyl-O-glycosyl-glycoprotein beta-1,6-N-acetylglucosaminyltransferase-like [Pygocentrus nattereri]XP_017551905.1 beta-1,3-galactosyl-O-glycosyl-glycoprotein beta-1,6-N-acetylglucosaminyltransferase-like [Pygocentrus nattereri]